MFTGKYGKEFVEQASSDVNCHRCGRARGRAGWGWAGRGKRGRPAAGMNGRGAGGPRRPRRGRQPTTLAGGRPRLPYSAPRGRSWNVNEALKRYVALEAPDPAVKLQTLSDIAQDHQVRVLWVGWGGGERK
jgi:hypothetical protein